MACPSSSVLLEGRYATGACGSCAHSSICESGAFVVPSPFLSTTAFTYRGSCFSDASQPFLCQLSGWPLLVSPPVRWQSHQVRSPLHLVGKRSVQSLMAFCDAGQCQSRLFFVRDRLSGHRFLVDTGADVSPLPSTHLDRRQNMKGASLLAAKRSVICSFGLHSLTLDLGLRRTFRWIFIVASVAHPVLGSKFLSFFNLSVHVRHRCLIYDSTLLTVNGIRSRGPSLDIWALLPPMPFEHCFSEYPALTHTRSLAAPVLLFVMRSSIPPTQRDHPVLPDHGAFLGNSSQFLRKYSNTCSNSGSSGHPRAVGPAISIWCPRRTLAIGDLAETTEH